MDLAIVVHTIDKYSFLWEGWYYFFRKYWDFSINARLVFMNEDVEVSFPGIDQVRTGPGEWSDRLKRGLEMLPESNVFYMQEDFWPIETLPRKYFEKAFGLFVRKKMDAFRITWMGNYRLFPMPHMLGGQLVYRFRNKSSMYLITHQSGFWRKDFFLDCLAPDESPWKNEIEGTERVRATMRPRVYMVKRKWYEEVCRRGELTAAGQAMMREVRNSHTVQSTS
ncbi:MAG: hypothetical protein ACLFOY_09955 [Desulfatibacillaceae bacterium]